MQLFKKKTTIKDRYFLKLNLAKTESKNIHTLIADEEEEKLFPEVTFETLEKILYGLAKELGDNQSLVIPKIELVLNQEGKTSTEDELFLKDFELDKNYQNSLKPLAETMFNMMPFSAAPFEDKLSYLKEVFESWQESTGLNDEHLPLLPDFELDDENYIEFIIPYYQNHTNEERELPQHPLPAPSQRLLEEKNEPSLPEVPESKEIVEDVVEEIVEFLPTEAPPKTQDFEPDFSPPQQNMLHETMELEFVPYSLEPFKLNPSSHLYPALLKVNKEIEQLNTKSYLLQKEIFEQKMARFDVEQHNQIALALKEKDHRLQLKKKLVVASKTQLQETIAFESKTAQENKDLALYQEEKAYEAKVAQIKHDAETALHERLQILRKDSSLKVQQELSRVLQEETQNLEAFLQESLLNLESEKMDEAEKISQEIQALVSEQNKSLQNYYAQKLHLSEEALQEISTPFYNAKVEGLKRSASKVTVNPLPSMLQNKWQGQVEADYGKKATAPVISDLKTMPNDEPETLSGTIESSDEASKVTQQPTQQVTQENSAQKQGNEKTIDSAYSSEATLTEQKEKRSLKVKILLPLVVVIIGGLGFLGGWMLFNHFSKPQTPAQPSQSQIQYGSKNQNKTQTK